MKVFPFNNLEERLTKNIILYFKENRNKEVINVKPIGIIERPFSTIRFLEIETLDGLEKLVMKSVKHHSINKEITERENQALVEYNILSKLYYQFSKLKNCSVPRPILVFPDDESYIMEYIEGNLLDEELDFARFFSSKEKFKRLEFYYYSCGQWLKYFQEFTDRGFAGPEILNGIIERCLHRLEIIKNLKNKKVPEQFYDIVKKNIEEEVAKLPDSGIAVSGRHGDFGPWNIIVNEHKITVIDFLGYTSEPVGVDLIKMLVNLEDEKMRIDYNPRKIDKLKIQFLKGYGRIPKVQRSVVKLIEILYRVSNVLAAIQNSNLSWPTKIEKRRSLRLNLDWFRNGIKSKLLWPA